MEEFPGNSQRRPAPRKEAPQTEVPVKKIERVVEGEVLQRKKPRIKRLREIFLGSDNRSIMEFIVQDVIIPNIRDMIYEAGQQGLERSLYPGSDPRPWRHGGPRGGNSRRHVTNYNGITRGGPPQPQERQMSRRGRANHDFGEIVLPTRPEADAVLQGLYAILEEYDVVAVSDLYEMVGISSQFTDRNWGWTDLFGSDIQRDRDGYLLILPPPVDIRR